MRLRLSPSNDTDTDTAQEMSGYKGGADIAAMLPQPMQRPANTRPKSRFGSAPGLAPQPAGAATPSPGYQVMTPEQEAQAGQNPGTPIYDPASQQPQPQAATGRDWEANPYTDADWESYNDPNRGGSTMEMTPEKERASAAQHKYAVAQGYETEGPHGGYYATDKFKQYQAGRQNPQQAAPQQPAYKSPMLGKRG